MRQVVYNGYKPEVELLMTGKRFRKNKPRSVTEKEYKAVIGRKDFKGYQPPKKKESKESKDS
ncbi:hypothetical protein LC065_20005 (plasmid) [Halobacillus litoralis]|uniref:hypothetical protein n=1 Tax=Halobacillus litoralis TaxID=45668 RepID=UPI001CFDED98|nr:hypothetical protein [Halobacillus litoralis]WLR49592.1 hypothetical protein LC065_20005 [Halobacillus litoralis]